MQRTQGLVYTGRETDLENNSKITGLLLLAFLFFWVGHKAPNDKKFIKIFTVPIGIFMLFVALLGFDLLGTRRYSSK